MRTLLIAALCLISGSALADCHTAIGGFYSFAHGGIKGTNMQIPGATVAGTFHSAHAFFTIDNKGLFSVQADINDQQVAKPAGPFLQEDSAGRWNWQDSWGKCWMHFGNSDSQMYGYVSDDGRFISITTWDDEMMWGTAFRVNP